MSITDVTLAAVVVQDERSTSGARMLAQQILDLAAEVERLNRVLAAAQEQFKKIVILNETAERALAEMRTGPHILSEFGKAPEKCSFESRSMTRWDQRKPLT